MSATYQDGAPIPGLYPALQNVVLQSISAASGIAAPSSTAASVVPLTPANTPVPLLGANPSRSYLLIYNPTQMPAQFSKGIAQQGAITNLSIGPGQAYFWATQQGLGQVYQGALTAVGLFAPLPLWVWEDNAFFYNDDGVLAMNSHPPGWPIVPDGLPFGAVWDNGLTVAIVGGGGRAFSRGFSSGYRAGRSFNPNPAAPPLFFGAITAELLLALGGANLPTVEPPDGSLQLWNNNGLVSIA